VRLLVRAQLREPLRKIEQQVADGLIAIRPSANLAADVGMRDNLLQLLACYNPLWLRLALEAIVGEAVPLSAAGHADAGSLRRFLDKRFLVAPVVAPKGEEGVHPEEQAKRNAIFAVGTVHKAIVRRVLAVIVLLDAAKQSKLLRSDPCLFLPDVTLKASRDIVQEFGKGFLSGGIGDINRHLGTLGITLVHKQTALHEYNFAVQSLGTDMRDGVRLCRLVDLTYARARGLAAAEDAQRRPGARRNDQRRRAAARARRGRC
jgi:abnormal spindle-like microcephaly-associated protein